MGRATDGGAFPSEARWWKPSHLWEGARLLNLAGTRRFYLFRALALGSRVVRALEQVRYKFPLRFSLRFEFPSIPPNVRNAVDERSVFPGPAANCSA
jgi:hypothetical protein